MSGSASGQPGAQVMTWVSGAGQRHRGRQPASEHRFRPARRPDNNLGAQMGRPEAVIARRRQRSRPSRAICQWMPGTAPLASFSERQRTSISPAALHTNTALPCTGTSVHRHCTSTALPCTGTAPAPHFRAPAFPCTGTSTGTSMHRHFRAQAPHFRTPVLPCTGTSVHQRCTSVHPHFRAPVLPCTGTSVHQRCTFAHPHFRAPVLHFRVPALPCTSIALPCTGTSVHQHCTSVCRHFRVPALPHTSTALQCTGTSVHQHCTSGFQYCIATPTLPRTSMRISICTSALYTSIDICMYQCLYRHRPSMYITIGINPHQHVLQLSFASLRSLSTARKTVIIQVSIQATNKIYG